MTPKTARSYSAKGKKKEFSWLCFVASVTLTVIKNNAESGPEWSFSRLGFLSLACCHSLCATRHEDRSPPHPSLKKGGRYYTYFNKQPHSVRVRRMHSILAPTLSSRVSLSMWFNSEPWFLRLQSTDSETASLLGLLSAGIWWARVYSARCRHCGGQFHSVLFTATWDHVVIPKALGEATWDLFDSPLSVWGTLGLATDQACWGQGHSSPFFKCPDLSSSSPGIWPRGNRCRVPSQGCISIMIFSFLLLASLLSHLLLPTKQRQLWSILGQGRGSCWTANLSSTTLSCKSFN